MNSSIFRQARRSVGARRFRVWALVCLAALLVPLLVATPLEEAVAADPPNPIAVENQQQGTASWQLGRPGFSISNDATGQIKGYASTTSVNKGGQLAFHVSVNPVQNFTASFYRMGYYGGLGARLMAEVGPIAGTRQNTCAPVSTTGMVDCAWTPTFNYTVPETWTTGVYLVVLTNAANFQSYMTFVVRDDSRTADLLYQQSVTTYQAYNNYPIGTGKSLYEFNSYGGTVQATNTIRAAKVSFDRPYADGYGSGQLAGNGWSWERYYIGWLEQQGYDVSYSTNLDTHTNGARLLDFKGFLSVGHDEYWSKGMFTAATAARDAGVNLGFFGSNTAYWQVRFEQSAAGSANRVMVSYKRANLDPVKDSNATVLFRDPPVNRPEQTLVGVQYTAHLQNDGNGAIYQVQNSDNWVWEGTGYSNGTQVSGILGYESDRLMTQYPEPANLSYTTLSVSPVVDAAGVPESASSAVYQAPSGAWVFATGTNHWSFGLGKPGVTNASIQRATSNVLDRFVSSVPPPPPAPAAPSVLTATAVSHSAVDLTWQDNSSNEASFSVERSPDGVTWSVVSSGLPPDSTSYRDSDLTASTAYRYRVRAVNPAGESNYSNTATVTTPAPTSVIFAESFPGENGAAWDSSRWTGNTGTAATLDVQSGAGRMAFQNVSGARALAVAQMTKQVDTEVLASYQYGSTAPSARGFLYLASRASGDWVSGYPGSSYFLQLTSDIGAVQLWKSQSGVTTSLGSANIATVTTAKQWVRLRVYGNTISTKIWTDGSPEPANWELTATDSSISAAGLVQLKWIRSGSASAANSASWDDFQVTSSLTPPAAPSGLSASVVSDEAIDLSWTDNATTETGYTVERAVNGAVGWTEVTLPAGTTSYRDTGLAASTTYQYRVKASNDAGSSAYSSTATATTRAAPPQIPAAPTGLQATAVSNSVIDLSWTDNATTEAVYTVERSQGGGAWTILTSSLPAGTATYRDTGLAAGTSYSYRVKASNASGSSPYSTVASATTNADPPQTPAAPTGLTAAATSPSTIRLSWTDVADNESGYTVEQSPDGVTWSELSSSLPAGTNTYEAVGLSAATSYSYRVKATNAAGSSGYSNTATATTPPAGAAVVFAESFTAADNAPWDSSRWITNTGSTASTDIQSNAGRMRFQNVANARALGTAQMTKHADTEVLMSYRFTSNATAARGYLYLASRASGDWAGGYPGSSYFLQLTSDRNTAQLWKSQAGTTTSLRSPTPIATTTTTKQWLRYRIEGNTISAKIWTDGTPEPTTWEITATDASITSAGLLQMKWQRGGGANASNDVVFDDITITNVG